MRRTDASAAGDGGPEAEEGPTGPDGAAFSFEAAAPTVDVSRGDRLRHLYEEYVYEPGLVAWDDRRTRVGALLLSAYVLVGTVGVWFYPEPSKNQVPRNLSPFENMDAPFGSTQGGVDVLAQAIHATPNMLVMVLAGAVFATAIAVVVGTVAGYKGGLTDRVVTTFSDVAMAIPGLPIVMVVAFLYSPENPLVIGPLIMINYWAGLGRSIRSQVLTLREEPYVEASRAMGVSSPRILLADVIPNLMPFILVNFAFAARYVVFASVGLYYLGVLPPGIANWGFQLDRAYNDFFALVTPGSLHLILLPMAFIMLLGLALVLMAQGLDRVFNPRVRTRLAGESESLAVEEDDEIVARGGV